MTSERGVPDADTGDSPTRWALLSDLSLTVAVERSVLHRVEPWIPTNARPANGDGDAHLAVQAGRVAVDPGTEPATLRLGSAEVWVDDGEQRAVLRDGRQGVSGEMNLGAGGADLSVRAGASGESAEPVYDALTVTAALLLGRLGRALIHAGAVIDTSGQAWLLPGSGRCGKSTTCATLVAGGWGLLADDQVVIGPEDESDEPDGPWAEGWPRAFHLDTGWWSSQRTGQRIPIDPEWIRSGCQTGRARVAALLFPEIASGDAERSSLVTLTAAQSLERLVRQSPWILADRATAAGGLRLLESLAVLPASRLVLAPDTYANPAVLTQLLRSVAPLD